MPSPASFLAVAAEIVAPLPAPAALPQFTTSVDFAIEPRGSSWVVVRVTHFIDRRGEKDQLTDDVSTWRTEAAALSELRREIDALPARHAERCLRALPTATLSALMGVV